MLKLTNDSKTQQNWKRTENIKYMYVKTDKRLHIYQMELCTNVNIRQLIFPSRTTIATPTQFSCLRTPQLKIPWTTSYHDFAVFLLVILLIIPFVFFSYFLHLQASLDWCAKGTKTSFMVSFTFLPWSYCSWTMCICNCGFRWLVEPAPPRAPVAPGATIALTMLSVLQKVNEHLCFNRFSAFLALFVLFEDMCCLRARPAGIITSATHKAISRLIG